jgi:hypothetical protein
MGKARAEIAINQIIVFSQRGNIGTDTSEQGVKGERKGTDWIALRHFQLCYLI